MQRLAPSACLFRLWRKPVDKTLDDLISRLTAIRKAEGKNIDIDGPALELTRKYVKGSDGEFSCAAIRLSLPARKFSE